MSGAYPIGTAFDYFLTPDEPFEPGGGGAFMDGEVGQRSADGKDEWLTPPEIIRSLGPFDLDPCAPVKRPWPMAINHFTIEDNGLRKVWPGRVWLNPPYDRTQIRAWMMRLAEHGDGIALTFARTDTEWFHAAVFARAQAILFLSGRITFRNVDGSMSRFNGGAPSCLIAYGGRNVTALATCEIPGRLVDLR